MFFSAGEASGDAYGAALTERLKERRSDLTFEGFGGRRMADAGVPLLADTSRWGAISIIEGLRKVPQVYFTYYRAKRQIRRGEPGLFIPIDFGFMNIKLARHAKNCGWKVLYFVPPGSWRRDRQGGDLPNVTDAIVTPFDFSAELLNKMGANCYWFGHPIKELIASRPASSATRAGIAALPGSRDHELEMHLPLLAAVVDQPVEFALAPAIDVAEFKQRWEALAGVRPDDRYTQGDIYAVLSRARAAYVCSGTATLEAALCGCPMVVFYVATKSTAAEAKLLRIKLPKFASLPNIITDEAIVPEFIQDAATVDNIKTAMRNLLENPQDQLAACGRLIEALGPSDAISKSADLAISMMA